MNLFSYVSLIDLEDLSGLYILTCRCLIEIFITHITKITEPYKEHKEVFSMGRLLPRDTVNLYVPTVSRFIEIMSKPRYYNNDFRLIFQKLRIIVCRSLAAFHQVYFRPQFKHFGMWVD